jgi:hypothetical protein
VQFADNTSNLSLPAFWPPVNTLQAAKYIDEGFLKLQQAPASITRSRGYFIPHRRMLAIQLSVYFSSYKYIKGQTQFKCCATAHVGGIHVVEL